MLATNVICPNCSRALKTTTPLSAGKTVLCRQCGTTFGVQPNNCPNTPLPNGNPSVAGGMNKLLVFGGAIAAVVVLMLVGTAAVLAVAFVKHRDTQPIANRTDTAADQTPQDPDKPLEYCPPLKPSNDVPTVIVTQTETPAEKPWLPKDEQVKVDKAIERGLVYLRNTQQNNGSWSYDEHASAMAALPALTLLECGVKADDPQVVKAADFIRAKSPQITRTYELALCVLFLDRLGDPKDETLLQTLALRLIAGQQQSGGWNYFCPLLSGPGERDLLLALRETRPARVPDSGTARSAGYGDPGVITTRPGENSGGGRIVPGGGGRILPPEGSGGRLAGKDGNDPTAVKDPKDGGPSLQGPDPNSGGGKLRGDGSPPPGTDRPAAKPAPDPEPAPKLDPAKLAQIVKTVPALQSPDPATRSMRHDDTDNSNTQFAILAIWVSGRHDVPTEKVCALIDRRFRTSQGTAGNWGYNYQPNPTHPSGQPAMTAAGLLGLAVGHGVSAPNPGEKPAPKEGLDDETIKKGFQFLSKHVGKSKAAGGKERVRDGVGLYFLWSVERVGVMYNLRTIGDKDWYAWGWEIIGETQNDDGSWSLGNYHRSTPQVDTSFALLFLKRANLAKDLSTKIEYLIDIKGIGNRN